MRHSFPDLAKLEAERPGIIRRAMAVGTLNDSHTAIDLPDDFDFGGEPPKEVPRPMRGLGDLVAKVAKPIARAIDAVAGTDMANCGGCAERQKKLNQAFPAKNAGTTGTAGTIN